MAPPTPTIVYNQKSAMLIVERKVLTVCPLQEVMTALLAGYYCFNIEYPKGTSLFFSVIEILLLGKTPRNIHTKVQAILAALTSVQKGN